MARYSKVVRKRKKTGLARFMPETVQAFIARRLLDAVATVLACAGLFVLIAVAGYDHADPSWNTATDTGTAVANWAGRGGAYVADLLLQTIGLGALALGAALFLWGVRLFRRDILNPFWTRIISAVAACLFFAMASARIPAGDWLTQAWMGGSGGTMMLDSVAGVLHGIVPSHSHMIVAIFAGVLGAGAMLWTAAVTRDEVAALFGFIWEHTVNAAQFVAAAAQSFIGWVQHYNDPDYEAPARKKKAKKAKPAATKRKAPALTAAGADEDDEEDEEEEDEDGEEYEEEEDSDEEYEEEDEAEEDEEDGGDSSFAARRIPAGMMGAIKVVAPKRDAAKKKKSGGARQTSFALEVSENWEMPTLDLLQDLPDDIGDDELDEEALQKNAELLQNVLNDFNVQGEIVSIHPGPVVTLYELEPAPGTKISRIIGLSDDIARSMSAVSVRCAVVPGRSVIGIELPNRKRQTVFMREILEAPETEKTKASLPLILGKNIGGEPVIADLAKMPHLLVAGTTGSGKSVAVNTMILSLLYRLPPEKCRFIMIDPKMLELSVYDDIPHLLAPVVTEPGKAIVALKWTVAEMEERYRAMSKLGVRNIEGYNQRLREAVKKGETLMRKVQTGFDPDSGKPVFEDQPMDMAEIPYIVVVVDEFADLMLVAGKEVEGAIQRLAQMARAAGIHLIMATQRPSVDVITGIIKANFPTRISFQVTSKIDSRTILNEGGAEQLLGMGDMLYMASGGRLTRVHGPFVSDEDVENVVSFLKAQGEPSYIDDVTEGGGDMGGGLFGEGGGSGGDELYDRAVALVAREGKASTSFIQRHLKIGYNRAATIIEEMERQGVVSSANHVGKREVLVGNH
jgi:S-DNA-T family DNA segregation ATPase FtsK/SpoIIIE